MTKLEAMTKARMKNGLVSTVRYLGFVIWNFLRHSSFELRHFSRIPTGILGERGYGGA
jgi:hypothetical protein